MSKIEYLEYGLVVAGVVAVVVVGVYAFSSDPYAPQLLFTGRLKSMGTPVMTSSNLFTVALTFQYNNQTINYQGFWGTIEGFKIGVVYNVYICSDGGFRIMQAKNQTM